MSPMPITRKQATRLVRRLPVNRAVSSVARSGSRATRIARTVLAALRREVDAGLTAATDYRR